MGKILIGAIATWAFASGIVSAGDFIAGADFSHLAFFESRGIVYKQDGQAKDGLSILKQCGLNCVRLRLFTSGPDQAKADPYNSINNLAYTVPLAVRAKNAGLRVLLDFHYSDTWADPGHQAKPAAWAAMAMDQLERQMGDYGSNCIAAFKAAGAMPEYVQIGNEITGGMLWPTGRVGGQYETAAQWSQLGRLMNAAIRGINDASGDSPPRIVVHIDRGGDWATTQWFFDRLLQQKVPFDIIGQSYYPFWHGSLNALGNCLSNTAARYGKPVIVAETAFPWTNAADIFGIPATTNGQVQFVVELAKIVKTVPAGGGFGIFWWGTEYVRLPGAPLAGFDQKSFFDAEGNTLPVASVFGQLAAPVKIKTSRNRSQILLDWPLSGVAMSLTMSRDLAESSIWLPVTNADQNTEAICGAILPKRFDSEFYRLQSK
jgi:arabinogalactan endo-1,4-beta-galactosidase